MNCYLLGYSKAAFNRLFDRYCFQYRGVWHLLFRGVASGQTLDKLEE